MELECARELKIIELEKKLKAVEHENKVMKRRNKKQNCELRNLESSINQIFTNGQIRKLKNPKKKN